MPSKSIPEPWQSFLTGIDTTLNESVELYCLGGFVINVLYNLARPTADVDVIAITPRSEIESLLSLAGQGSDPHRKHKVYLQLVGVATVPDSYDERLTEIAQGSSSTSVCSPSILMTSRSRNLSATRSAIETT